MFCRRFFIHLAWMTACAGLALSSVACGSGSPSAPTGTMTTATTATAAIDSVITTFHGAVVESNPITIASPEALDVEIGLTLGVPADSRITLYLCAMETASAIGVGNCIGLVSAAGDMQTPGKRLRMGISTLKTDGVARTTTYVYVGVVEGAVPWPLSGTSPPRVGDRFGANRVLATAQIARTVTFR
jgi:hypothetical protein